MGLLELALDDFEPGDNVRVEYDTTVIRGDGQGKWFDSARNLKVTRIDPENWPPQPGDVWKTENGKLYFVRTDSAGMRFTSVENLTGTYSFNQQASMEAFKRRKPVLAYRDGEKPESPFDTIMTRDAPVRYGDGDVIRDADGAFYQGVLSNANDLVIEWLAFGTTSRFHYDVPKRPLKLIR